LADLRFGLLAYGSSPRLHREAAAALLTVRAHRPPDTEIVVLTDRPDLYRWLADAIVVDALSAATLRAWRGPTDDRFRPKMEAARRLAAAGDADVVLIDADTMARAPLAPLAEHLAAGGLVLHKREYRVAQTNRRGDRALKHEVLGRTWGGAAAGDDTWMWNGGVLGSSKRHGGVFDAALAAFDQMRAVSSHFALEQLAYSIVFPAYGPVVEAERWFTHYWANRHGFDRAIERFLSEALLERLDADAAAERLRDRPIVAPLDGRVPWWTKRLRRLLKIEDVEERSS
jgi:hypothetical protein